MRTGVLLKKCRSADTLGEALEDKRSSIDVRLKNMPERGVVGLGEPPTVPTAAAVALAVRNAIGVSVRSLPLTPMKILQSLQQKA